MRRLKVGRPGSTARRAGVTRHFRLLQQVGVPDLTDVGKLLFQQIGVLDVVQQPADRQ